MYRKKNIVLLSGFNWTSLADAAIEDNCHEDETVRATIQFFTSSHREMATVSTTASTVAALVKRNESSHQCDIITSTGMVNDGASRSTPFPPSLSYQPLLPFDAHTFNAGNPHQNFYDMQLSVSDTSTGFLRGDYFPVKKKQLRSESVQRLC